MKVTDYDNMTDDYNKNNCTTDEKIIDITIPTILLTILCGISFF